MVCFASFRYVFPISKKTMWTGLINRGFKGCTTRVELKIDTKTNIGRDIEFGDNTNFANFINEFPNATECTVMFDRIWDEMLFWNSMPSIDRWVNMQISAPNETDMHRCQTAVNALTEQGKYPGGYEIAIHAKMDIPFDHIKWIMCEVHKVTPIQNIYYSPSSQQVNVRFRDSHGRYSFTPTTLTNCAGVVFDYDDGFTSHFGSKTWCDEMEADFATWKERQDTEIFKLY